MARKKVYKYETLVESIKWDDENQERGVLRFQFLKLPTPFRSTLQNRDDILEYTKRVALDIKMLETVPVDPSSQTKCYPFSVWQIDWIEETGHKLLADVQSAFTVSSTFRDIWELGATETMKEQIAEARYAEISFFDKDISQVTSKEIAQLFKQVNAWKNLRNGKPLETSSRYAIQRNIRTIFNYAEKNGLLTTNVFKKDSGLIKEEQLTHYAGKKTYLTFEQVSFYYSAARIIDLRNYDRAIVNPSAWKNHKPVFWHNEMFARFGVFTGARWGDLSEATWAEFKNITNNHCTWTFKQRKHKHHKDWAGKSGDKKYSVTINDFKDNPLLLEMIRAKYKARKSDDEKVFSTISGNQNSIKALFKQIVELANKMLAESGINDDIDNQVDADGEPAEPVEAYTWTVHEMRHTMVSQFVSGSMSWDAASKRCGHATVLQTITTYGEMFDKEIKKAEAKKNAYILRESAAAELRIQAATQTVLRSVN